MGLIRLLPSCSDKRRQNSPGRPGFSFLLGCNSTVISSVQQLPPTPLAPSSHREGCSGAEGAGKTSGPGSQRRALSVADKCESDRVSGKSSALTVPRVHSAYSWLCIQLQGTPPQSFCCFPHPSRCDQQFARQMP